jgi:uncharacterized OB-fold protein
VTTTTTTTVREATMGVHGAAGDREATAAGAQGAPVVEGLFEVHDGVPALAGAKCGRCGTHYFPRRARCSNPACEGAPAEAVRLGRRGTLYSWSLQAYRPPPLFGMEPWAPYAIGLVDLPEGVRVMAMLTGIAPDAHRIGSAMELRLEPLSVGADGRGVLTWKFAPVAGPLAGSAS